MRSEKKTQQTAELNRVNTFKTKNERYKSKTKRNVDEKI